MPFGQRRVDLGTGRPILPAPNSQCMRIFLLLGEIIISYHSFYRPLINMTNHYEWGLDPKAPEGNRNPLRPEWEISE